MCLCDSQWTFGPLDFGLLGLGLGLGGLGLGLKGFYVWCKLWRSEQITRTSEVLAFNDFLLCVFWFLQVNWICCFNKKIGCCGVMAVLGEIHPNHLRKRVPGHCERLCCAEIFSRKNMKVIEYKNQMRTSEAVCKPLEALSPASLSPR